MEIMPVRVKICGITNLEDAEAAVAAGADALGFILYEKSKRFISIEDAIRIVEELPPFVQTVAVTVNATKEFANWDGGNSSKISASRSCRARNRPFTSRRSASTCR